MGPKGHQDLRRFFDGRVAIWHKSDERFFLSRFTLFDAQEKILEGVAQLKRMLVGFALSLFSALLFFTFPADTEALSKADVSFSSDAMDRGGVILVTVKADEQKAPRIIWLQKDVPLVYSASDESWSGFISADLHQETGLHDCMIRELSSGFQERYPIRIRLKDYGVRRLKLPKTKVELDAHSLKRVKNEAAVIHSLWPAGDISPKWKGQFLMPVDGDIVGTFGRKSIINHLHKSPHTGVDLAGKKGDPVVAINSGRVLLVADHFFSGKSVYVNHGGGIISMYSHLDKILVSKGDDIQKGEVVGLLGATGRVTGPHLHWGVRINGNRINPLTLIELSGALKE